MIQTMNFKWAVTHYFRVLQTEHYYQQGIFAEGSTIPQPSQHHSVKNRLGWHLYNCNGYLGSIDKHGQHVTVKSRTKGDTNDNSNDNS